MNSYRPQNVINGSFGKLNFNGLNMAEVTGFEAKLSIDQEEVKQTGTTEKGYKNVGTDGKGTIKLNKVTSYFIDFMLDSISKGVTPEGTIISLLADPDAYGGGVEAVQLDGCTFNEVTLADWEAKKLGEESIPFTFRKAKLLSKIGWN